MRVREATKEDFDEIARLTIDAYRALDTWVGDDYAGHLADVAGRANAENTTVLVAEDDIPVRAAVGAAIVAGAGDARGTGDVPPTGVAAATDERVARAMAAGRRILGSVTLTIGGGPFFEWDPDVDGDCGFRMLAVDPAVQGRGVGPRLVAECLDRARAAGCRRMIIGSTEWMTTAHRIYERLGFRRAPELDQQWGDIRGLCFVLDL
jgi:GNAT superfamily N-acetyltransferase